MERSRTGNSILNIFVGIGGYVINTILGLVCRMVFTRTLAVDYLGINGLFTNILTMLSLAELGIGSAIVYALYKPLATDDKEKIASLVHFYGKCYRIIGCVVGVAGLALLPFLKFLIREQPNIHESLYVIYLLYLFNTASTYFFSYRASLLTAAQKNYLVSGLNYVFTIIQSIVQMVLLVTTHNYMTYLLTQTISVFAYNFLISYIAKKRYPYIVNKDIKPLDKAEKASLAKNIKALVIIKLSGMLVNNTDNMIITYFNGLITVGYASNYTLLSTTLNSLLTQIFTGANASIGNYNALENKEKKKGLFDCLNLANFWLFGWAAVGIFVVSSDIIGVFFGNQYIMDISIPFIIALNFYIVGMQNAVWTFKNTLGLFRPGRYLLLLTAAINLVCSIWLGNIWGLFGIYLATAISRILTNVWYEPYAIFKYGFKMQVRSYYIKYFMFFLVLFLTGGICYILCENIHFSPLLNVIIKMLICTIIPNVFFYLFFGRSSEFRHLFEIVKGIITKCLGKWKNK